MNKVLYTLVAHTGLPDAVELAHVNGKKHANAIRRAGGVLFHSYQDADNAEYMANYFEVDNGLMPKAKGAFVPTLHDGQKVFAPSDELWDQFADKAWVERREHS